jgi:hypothetical protein
MLTAQAHIQTEHPSRYLVQLCRHANNINHKGQHLHEGQHLHVGQAQVRPEVLHVEWTDTDGILSLNWGQCTMQAGPDTLTLRVEATDEENLQRVQDLLAGDLERFGRRDQLKVTWQRSSKPTVQPGEAG